MIYALWLTITVFSLYILRLVFKAYSNPQEGITAATGSLSGETSAHQDDITAVYQNSLTALNEQLRNGDITRKEFSHLKHELDQQYAYEDAISRQSDARADQAYENKGFLTILAIVAAVMIMGCVYFYLQWSGSNAQWMQVQSAYKPHIEASIQNDHQPVEDVLQDADTYRAYLRALHARVLADREQDPDTLRLLANSYARSQMYDLAAPLYGSLLALPDQSDNETKIDYAQSLMMERQGQFTPEAAGLLNEVMQSQEQPSFRVMYLLGLGAYTSGNYQVAMTSWEPLLAMQDPSSQQYQSLNALYQDAVAKQNASATTSVTTAEAAEEVSLAIDVNLDEALRSDVSRQLAAGQSLSLVVYAKDESSPMPIAAVRRPLSAGMSWPQRIKISEADALTQARGLSEQTAVIIGARIARGEEMRAKEGDYQSAEFTIEVDGNEPFNLIIDDVVAQ